jgi:hypothetical protein
MESLKILLKNALNVSNQKHLYAWKRITGTEFANQELAKNLEPIPLRTLTVLLNYERYVSDPRFQGIKLHLSTLTDPDSIER